MSFTAVNFSPRSFKRVSHIAISAILALSLICSPAFARKIKISRTITGSLLTNVAGSSVSQPPYIQVIRSREGFDYLMGRFERLKNRITRKRLNRLKAQMRGFDYDKSMLIGVFSQPMDNYKIKLEKVTIDPGGKAIDVKVTYRHKIRSLRIPPKKSIHYLFVVIPKSDFPVILSATQMAVSGKKKSKLAKVVTVTGRLMALTGNDLQLVPVVIRRGRKNSYYIRGDQALSLNQHVGKVVTLKGMVSHERNSPYEWDFTVSKVVKILN